MVLKSEFRFQMNAVPSNFQAKRGRIHHTSSCSRRRSNKKTSTSQNTKIVQQPNKPKQNTIDVAVLENLFGCGLGMSKKQNSKNGAPSSKKNNVSRNNENCIFLQHNNQSAKVSEAAADRRRPETSYIFSSLTQKPDDDAFHPASFYLANNHTTATTTTDQFMTAKKITQCRNFHDILGVPSNASEIEIKAAYRKLALQFHPDKNQEPDASEAFQMINNAFTSLTKSSGRTKCGHCSFTSYIHKIVSNFLKSFCLNEIMSGCSSTNCKSKSTNGVRSLWQFGKLPFFV